LYGILPSSYTVTPAPNKPAERQKPFASGGFADVWKVSDKENPELVFAVKQIRVTEEEPVEEINKRYCKEAVVFKWVKHQNILSIEGVAPELFEYCLVSRWMPNGNMHAYIKHFPAANRLELLIGVTRGLEYLHDSEVVHGDLKSGNILIDAEHTPRLTDFGVCSITRNIYSLNASTPKNGCTFRYCAPELLDFGESGKTVKKKPTTETDIYSLSMVIVELVTGEMPFFGYSDAGFTVAISKHKRPSEPRRYDAPGMTPLVWKVAKRCWHEKAKERPEVKIVLRDLENIVANGNQQISSPGFRQTLRHLFSD